MLKNILISFFAMLFFTAATGQQRGDDTVTVNANDDTAEVQQKVIMYVDTALQYKQPYLSPDTAKAWKELREFAYAKNLDSLLKDAKDKQNKKEANESQDTDTGWLGRIFSSEITKVFFWALAVFFVLFILYKLFLSDGVFRRAGTSSKSVATETQEPTITSESDLEVLIRQAVQSGNYRLAVRYHYLQSLYKLAANKLVELAADKTNYQYVREIANASYQNDFAALTLNYEYVWYGEFAIDENIYKRLEPAFLQFNSKL